MTYSVDSWLVFQNVEPDSFCKWSALSDGYNIPFLNIHEAGGAVYRDILVSLFKTSILADVLQIVSSNDHCPLHLIRNYHCFHDSSSDRHVSRKRALFVDVCSVNSLFRRFEAESDILVESKPLQINTT